MKPGKKLIGMAGKIAAWLLAVDTEEDRRSLNEWKQGHAGRIRLLEEMSDPDDFQQNEEMLSRFPAQEGWQKISGLLDRKRKRMIRPVQWIQYAALAVLVCGSAFLIFRMKQPSPVEIQRIVQSMPAGKQGARLTLGNGKTVDISPGQHFELAEKDGTVIRQDSSGVHYQRENIDEDATIVNRMETLTGMEYSLLLSDGTRVYLNAESSLSYPTAFRGKQRIVELKGEAFFQVTKDPEHPFVVKMSGVELTVTGTTFNVRSYADEQQIVATLVEGIVAVNGRQIVPGEQAVYSKKNKELAVHAVDVDRYIAWQQGKFVFRNERLEDVLMTLSRWYGIEYHFLDDAAREIRIGASFGRYNNMDPIMNMLKQTELVDVLQTNRSVYISSRK